MLGSCEERARELIEKLRAQGKLRALPIGPVNWSDGTISTFDGRALRPYGADGTWVFAGEIEEGAVRYLGSASHGGKIELKALYVFAGGLWRNIVTGKAEAPGERKPVFAS